MKTLDYITKLLFGLAAIVFMWTGNIPKASLMMLWMISVQLDMILERPRNG